LLKIIVYWFITWCFYRHNGTRRQSHMEVKLLRENDCMSYFSCYSVC